MGKRPVDQEVGEPTCPALHAAVATRADPLGKPREQYTPACRNPVASWPDGEATLGYPHGGDLSQAERSPR